MALPASLDPVRPRSATAELTDVSMRRANRGDLEVLLSLETEFPSDRISRRAYLRALRSPSVEVWVAERQGTVAGVLILHFRSNSRAGNVYSILTHPDHRRRGVGAAQYRFAMERARARGCEALTISVRSDNPAGQALAERVGFQRIAGAVQRYSDGHLGVRMRLNLERLAPSEQPRGRESGLAASTR